MDVSSTQYASQKQAITLTMRRTTLAAPLFCAHANGAKKIYMLGETINQAHVACPTFSAIFTTTSAYGASELSCLDLRVMRS